MSYADVRTCLASDTPGKMEIIPGKTRQNAEAERSEWSSGLLGNEITKKIKL